MISPYREPDFRCEARTISGEQCILTIGHQGPHALRGGDIWMAVGGKDTADEERALPEAEEEHG